MHSLERQKSMNRRVYDTFLPAKNDEYLDVNQLNSLLKDLWKEDDQPGGHLAEPLPYTPLSRNDVAHDDVTFERQDAGKIWDRSQVSRLHSQGNSSSSIYLPPCVPSKQPSRLPSPPRGVMKTLNPWGYEENPDAKSLSIWAEKTRCQNRSSLGAVMHPQKPAQTQDKISHAAKSGTESRCTGIADASKDNSVSNITNMGFFPILSQDVRRNNFTLDQQLPLGIDTSVKSAMASASSVTHRSDVCWNNRFTLPTPSANTYASAVTLAASEVGSASQRLASHLPQSQPITSEQEPRNICNISDSVANFLMLRQFSPNLQLGSVLSPALLTNSSSDVISGSIAGSDSGCETASTVTTFNHSNMTSSGMMSSNLSQSLSISPSSVNLNSFTSADNGWNSDAGSSSGCSPGVSEMSGRNLASPTEPIECSVNSEIPGSVQNHKKFKTKMCLTVSNGRECMYGERCQFSHNMEELRPSRYPANYKKIKCRQFHTTGKCQFAGRCTYVHDLSPLEMQMIKEFKELKGFNEFLKSL